MPSRMPRPVLNALSTYAEPDYPDTVAERVFQDNVERRAIRYGLLVYHTHDSRGSRKGWPDLVVAGPGGAIFRELKTAKGTTTMEQERWLALLRQIGMDAKVWRPADIRTGEIAQTFARLCQPLQLSDVQTLTAEVIRLRLEVEVADAAARVIIHERDNARAQLDAAREELRRLRQVPEVGGGRR